MQCLPCLLKDMGAFCRLKGYLCTTNTYMYIYMLYMVHGGYMCITWSLEISSNIRNALYHVYAVVYSDISTVVPFLKDAL